MDRHLQALHMVVNPMLTSQLLLPKEILEDRRQHKEAMAEALHLEEVMVVHHLQMEIMVGKVVDTTKVVVEATGAVDMMVVAEVTGPETPN